jgi:hypothetical protein
MSQPRRRQHESPVVLRTCSLAVAALALWVVMDASAKAQPAQGNVELSFTPTDRVQIAVWVERDDGAFMGTFALTHAVAVAGIGNRPGALQMNSGYRWPYGRREGVLPVWAHRRASAPGAKQFRRVIFQDRKSEGDASRSSDDHSRDDYYCLSFTQAASGHDALDAVTCASVFSSDKGRFIAEADVQRKYGEPFQNEAGSGSSRPLSLHSLYPPRRDVTRCTAVGDCFDHEDVASFALHAREVMPELDAISHPTAQGERRVTWTFSVPHDWSREHRYSLFIEANVEGDYNERWGPERFPTPSQPDGGWDEYALGYGYPYRGQPSVVYELPFTIGQAATVSVSEPVGYGALQGEDGELRPIDATISDDPGKAKGSGADRLRSVGGSRATLRVTSTDPCALPNAPATCGMRCSESEEGCGALVCDEQTDTCRSYCAATEKPGAVQDLRVERYPDKLRAHMWARLSFRAAESERPIGAYEVRVKPHDGEWGAAFTHDSEHELRSVALDVCNDPEAERNRCGDMQPGTMIEVDLAELRQSTRYSVSVTPRDAQCHEPGPTMLAEFTTPERSFTTVSPCFIATAAYGSPLASQVAVLRRVRDRHLAPHAPGRMLIELYYEHGPTLAAFVREHGWLRALSRAVLTPIVALSRWSID